MSSRTPAALLLSSTVMFIGFYYLPCRLLCLGTPRLQLVKVSLVPFGVGKVVIHNGFHVILRIFLAHDG